MALDCREKTPAYDEVKQPAAVEQTNRCSDEFLDIHGMRTARW
jgi:hypothetical protein